ncbi:aminotransferase class IV [Allokutzneria sp. A3M-2-11 16]|uniref:aminotransferase class IV n=1 Tax=Allokutzneria sp. A3M-2-11 16 TaxID=2962043 RepID=UPI0020B8435A|nr:aminotransferase class IV [Allokutzneria sp. A3M-2-11 16]MCP3804524.1 aminotransferase class IV [Allokutzneria sp. A3M-2-11 16]
MDAARTVAVFNYGHFTAMRAENGRIRGLGLHLERLDRDARLVFGEGLDAAVVRAAVRAELGDRTDPVNVRVNVFSPDVTMSTLDNIVAPTTLVTVRPAAPWPDTAMRLRSVVYERDLPHVKHVGTFGLLLQRRLARLAGHDDALFVNRSGHISEGTVWNVGFYDGSRVVLPSAPALPGIAIRLVCKGLRQLGVPVETRRLTLSDLPGFRSAFATNEAIATQPIASVDEAEFTVDEELNSLLRRAYLSNPAEPLEP